MALVFSGRCGAGEGKIEEELSPCALQSYWTLPLTSFLNLGTFPGLGLLICKVGVQCSTYLIKLWRGLSETVHVKHLGIVCDTK